MNTETAVNRETDANAEKDTDTDTNADTEIEYTLGDINQDGMIDYLDVIMALRYDAELITFDDIQLYA